MGILSKLLGRADKGQPPASKDVEVQSGGFYFEDWNGNIYDNDIVRAAIWTNAKHAGKLNPKHIRKAGGKYDLFPTPKVKRILERPNPFMGMSVFINKMVTQCEKKNNAFALVRFDGAGDVEGLYPISYSQVEAVESHGFYFVTFRLLDGSSLTVKYQELIHLRKHIDEKDVFGEDNAALNTVMDVVETTDKGIVNAIRKSAIIRWILKFNNVLQPEDKKTAVADFVTNYLSIENSGGAAATDPRYTAEQVKAESFVPNAAQMDTATQRIFAYFGVSLNIIQSKFNETEWNAYYESTIEPYAIQLAEEFTEKLFTPRERECGNRVIFDANRLQYASNKTKVAVGRFLADVGAARVDDILEIFNMAPLGGEDGQRRVQTLNMVNADKADEYQLGEGKKKKDADDEESEDEPDEGEE